MPPKPRLTHFVCFPLVTSTSRSQLEHSLSGFAADVSKLTNTNGQPQVPRGAIRPVATLHLTIGVMSLESPDRIAEACQFLKSLDVSGLLRAAALNQSDQSPETDLQAPGPDGDEKFSDAPRQPLSSHLPKDPSSGPTIEDQSSLHDAFLAAGFMLPPPNNRSLKLHASLVNVVYVKRSAGGKNCWGTGSVKIDAREVIERWGETTWAENVRVEKVAICEMGAEKSKNQGGKVVDEVYKEVASVDLP